MSFLCKIRLILKKKSSKQLGFNLEREMLSGDLLKTFK